MKKTSIFSNILFIILVAVVGVVTYYATLSLVNSNTAVVGSTTETVATGTTLVQLEDGTVIFVDNEAESLVKENIVVDDSQKDKTVIIDSGTREIVTLAGGCFWCTEAYLQETEGVVSAVSGYAGGSAESADYKTVSTGNTEHREAVQVVFDPRRVSFKEILEVYWSHIDPTDAGGQFADRGFHYTTAIFYHTNTQRQTAEASKQALQDSNLFSESIATKILPYTTFFAAEAYHQDYYQKASAHYERYKKASGRAGFIEDNWAKEAAIQFFEGQEVSISTTPNNVATSNVYVERTWSADEIAAALKLLPTDVYHIVAEEGTERAFQNAYYDNKEAGVYVDVVTGKPLFSSTHKYDSKTGWPSFYQPISSADIIEKTDYKLLLPRTEVRSVSGHLGHVFSDGPKEYGGKRYCINSLALEFIPYTEMKAKGYNDYLYLFE